MSFNDNVRLDPTQVRDSRGRGGMGGPIIAGGGGIGILVLVISLLLGVNPLEADPTGQTTPLDSGQTIQECRTGADANRRDDCRIVGYVDSIQQYWSEEFARRGQRYSAAETVLFSGYVQAGCGTASTAQGPFYCPTDEKVYLDLSFFEDLRTRFGAQGGPFVQGYVVAHEYGHHVQNRLGLLASGRSADQSASVRTELQADCLAGVWAKHASATGYLRPLTNADIASALDAAAAIGDDRIQHQTEGRVTPERWTHGSSAQRQQWFNTGLNTGELTACDPR
ncbi:neutral zinc metallopeptidase [soil metagenome]